jgi:hypothetical protein
VFGGTVDGRQRTLSNYSNEEFEILAEKYRLLQLCRRAIEKLEDGIKDILSAYFKKYKLEKKYRGDLVEIDKIVTEYTEVPLPTALKVYQGRINLLIERGVLVVDKEKFLSSLNVDGIEPKPEFFQTSKPPSEKYRVERIGELKVDDPTIKELEDMLKKLSKIEITPQNLLIKQLEESLKKIAKE